ncbi:MAG: hypothetical protein J0M15_12360 [Deltaproteobacteria bacterium]|jgi:tRNA U34 5-methylaminomethyl-2-thiouridine-forming methyltransferase MnmC|nr:hypothetical protein [Deltaproteobacteria bacterium]
MDVEKIQTYLELNGYTFELTEDGSPTLRLGQGESMHHFGGAAGESLYIYQTALDFLYSNERPLFEISELKSHSEDFLKKKTLMNSKDQINSEKLNIMSLGFGLGYNELLVALWAIKNKFEDRQTSLVSFEIDSFFYNEFNKWLTRSEETPMTPIYDLILNKILELNHKTYPENESGLLDQIKSKLLNWKLQGIWRQQGELMNVKQLAQKFNLFIFDAFSVKTTPHLWSNDFLEPLLSSHRGAPCVFSTYACRGELKRFLQRENFIFLKRPGFKGKRNSTLAFRE